MAKSLLVLRDVDVLYGPIRALKGVSLSVNEGEIVAALGANGAGKSTLLRAISGLIHPAKGTIEFQGSRIDRLEAEKTVRTGIAHVPEGRGIFPGLTVLENLKLGAYVRKDADNLKRDYAYVWRLFPILDERRSQLAGTLSGGEQQMLALARGLLSGPKLLLVDELSLGLGPIVVKNLFSVILQLEKRGTAILLVEQNVQLALSIANRGYVLKLGEIVIEDTAENLRESREVHEAYLI